MVHGIGDTIGLASLAGIGTATLASMTALPSGFEDWKVTAMLAFLVLTCLGIIVYIVHSNNKASVKFAETLTKVTERQAAQSHQSDVIVTELRSTTIALNRVADKLENRPCIGRN